MSHEVETMMFLQGNTPWHGLGTAVDGKPTAEQAIVASGLDWRVDLAPLAIKRPLTPAPTSCPGCAGAVIVSRDLATIECTGYLNGAGPCGWKHQQTEFALGADAPMSYAAVRSSDGKVLSTVGTDWTPLQNREAFAWFDPFVEQGLATYCTAGSLRGGEFVWVLAKLAADNSIVGSDEIGKFILLSNAHNGERAVRVGFTPICVVCANTLKMAHDDSASSLIRVRHTESVVENMKLLRDTMNTANQSFEATAEQYRLLAMTDIVEADLKRYLRTVFFSEAEKDNEKIGVRVLDKVLELYEGGRGAQERKNTLWKAYQAVTEYLSYGRGKDNDRRLSSLWFAEGGKLNTKALFTALGMVGNK